MVVAQRQLLFNQVYLDTEGGSVPWSYSRRNKFEQCLLWYYYSYYGASARTALAEPRKEELRFLSTLQGIDLRVGKILHFMIEQYLKRLKTDNQLSADDAVRWASNIFQKDLNVTLGWQRTGNLPEDPYSSLLLEFYYRQPDAGARWGQANARLRKALTNFFQDSALKPFQEGASTVGAMIERPVTVRDSDFVMHGKIDLAYAENGRIKVVDWKIRSSGGNDDKLQLVAYSLPIIDEFKCSPEAIDVFKVHLYDGTVSQHSISEQEVRRGRMRIVQDSVRMKALDSYGREAVSDAFTPCEQPRICRMCPFQSLCARRVKYA